MSDIDTTKRFAVAAMLKTVSTARHPSVLILREYPASCPLEAATTVLGNNLSGYDVDYLLDIVEETESANSLCIQRGKVKETDTDVYRFVNITDPGAMKYYATHSSDRADENWFFSGNPVEFVCWVGTPYSYIDAVYINAITINFKNTRPQNSSSKD